MRIALFGTHKVGKTTLAEELLEKLPEYTLEVEPYYQLESSGHEFLEEPTAEDFVEQFNYSARLISQSGEDVIFDRCVLDILAYLHILDPKKNIQSLFEKTITVLAEIDILVFVPIEEPDLIHCQKSDLPKLRSQVNDLLLDWIDDLGIQVIEVHGTPSSRCNQILAKLKS